VSRELTVRGVETRKQLERHGTHLFTEQGYQATSVDQIVDSVGVGKGVFYWYFSSKEEFLASLVDGAWRDLRSLQELVIGDEPDAVRQIELYIRSTVAWTAENPNRASLFGVAESEHRLRALLDKGRSDGVNFVQQRVKAGMDAGLIPPGDSLMLSVAIRSVLMALVRDFRDLRTRDQIADTTVAFVLQALRSADRSDGKSGRGGGQLPV
jgi:TetR/AcrR family transcriptional regulator, cholesterol catabolism regulator